MKTFFAIYIDFVTLGLALFISVFVAVKTWQQSAKRTRIGILPFLFLAPVLITTSMASHLFEITYHAVESRFTGRFSYSFYLYSLYLLAIVLINVSLRYYRQTRSYCLSKSVNKVDLLKTAGLIAVISLPAVKISPIAALPSIISVISLLSSLVVHKGKKERAHLEAHQSTIELSV